MKIDRGKKKMDDWWNSRHDEKNNKTWNRIEDTTQKKSGTIVDTQNGNVSSI